MRTTKRLFAVFLAILALAIASAQQNPASAGQVRTLFKCSECGKITNNPTPNLPEPCPLRRDASPYDQGHKWYTYDPDAKPSDGTEAQPSGTYSEALQLYERKNYGAAFKRFEQLAAAGDLDSLYKLAECYMHGFGVAKSEKEAAKLYQSGARQGHRDSQHTYGYCLYHGKGVPRDLAESLKWYKKAAEQGDVEAQYNVGLRHELGQGVNRDINEANRWYKMAAANGHSLAKAKVGSSSSSTGTTLNVAGNYRQTDGNGSAVITQNGDNITVSLKTGYLSETKSTVLDPVGGRANIVHRWTSGGKTNTETIQLQFSREGSGMVCRVTHHSTSDGRTKNYTFKRQ